MSRREEIVEESECTEDSSINGRYHRFNVKLGKGAFKEVFKAFDTHEQIDCAWNSIDLSLINTEDEKKKIFKECEMLRRLNHPNILKITNQWFNEKTDKLCFITNIVHDGSLAKFFRKRQVNLLRVKQICKQILNALLYLHQMGVIHRDLKCDNVFIEGNTGKVVLGDLGLSCNVISARSIVGTPHWMAPELYKEDYNEMVDIWSFGMCVLELITSEIPYQECRGAFQVYQNISAGKKPQSLDKINDAYVRAFINICLNLNHTMRPSADELLDHPFLLEKPSDTTLCSQLMVPKEQRIKEPPPTKEEQEEKEQLDQQLKSSRMKPPAKSHHFKPEPSTSPAPPTNLLAMTESNNNLSTLNSGTATTATISASKRTQKKREKVEVKKVSVMNNGDTYRIKLQIVCTEKYNKPMNVEFDFSQKEERASTVAAEMTRDLDLPPKFTAKVEKAINDAISKAGEQSPKQDALSSSPASTALPESEGVQAQQAPNAEIPAQPPLEIKSRKSLGPGVGLAVQSSLSQVAPAQPANMNTLPHSTTSLTASVKEEQSPSTQPAQQQSNGVGNAYSSPSKDPMYNKPANSLFTFKPIEQTYDDLLTQGPPKQYNNSAMQQVGGMMPMIDSQSSPDPPLSVEHIQQRGYVSDSYLQQAHSDHHGDNADDVSSIGSMPLPNTQPGTKNNTPNSGYYQPQHQFTQYQQHQHVLSGGSNHSAPSAQPLVASQSVPAHNVAFQRQQQAQQQLVNGGSSSSLHANQNANQNGMANYATNQQMNGYQTAYNNANAHLQQPRHSLSGTNMPPISRTQSLPHQQQQQQATGYNGNKSDASSPTQGPMKAMQGQPAISALPGTGFTRSSSQHSATSAQSYPSPKLPPVPAPESNAISMYSKNPNPPPIYRSISPPKSTTPPTPPPVIGIDLEQKHEELNRAVAAAASASASDSAYNQNGSNYASYNSRTRATSPPPQTVLTQQDSGNRSKQLVLSTGLTALHLLSVKSSEHDIFRATLKLSEGELAQEFQKRNISYSASEGKTVLARKLVNVLREELKLQPVETVNDRKARENQENKENKPMHNNVNSKAEEVSTPATLELPNGKENSPDTVFSAKSNDSAAEFETVEKLSKQRDSGRETALRLVSLDSNNSSYSHDSNVNNDNNNGRHNYNKTTIIHPSGKHQSGTNIYSPLHKQPSIEQKGLTATSTHNIAPSQPHVINTGHINGPTTILHHNHSSSASNMTMASMNGTQTTIATMGSMMMQHPSSNFTGITALSMGRGMSMPMGLSMDDEGMSAGSPRQNDSMMMNGHYHNGYSPQHEAEPELATIASLNLPFKIEELALTSPRAEIVFGDKVLGQIRVKRHELHNEYQEFVKRKNELLQLRYATLETENKGDQEKFEMKKKAEQQGMAVKIHKKRQELADKFHEWLSDREQIAELKSRIKQKRNSTDKLPTFEVSLDFEHDEHFAKLMESELADQDKHEMRAQIEQFRDHMISQYKQYYLTIIQTYNSKRMQQMQQMQQSSNQQPPPQQQTYANGYSGHNGHNGHIAQNGYHQ